jgi:membrane dipeptidase
MIDYVCQLTGSAEYVGIGTDFDGGFGVESIPRELDTVGDLWQVAGALEARGYEQEHIDGIMAGNFLRILRRGLPT